MNKIPRATLDPERIKNFKQKLLLALEEAGTEGISVYDVEYKFRDDNTLNSKKLIPTHIRKITSEMLEERTIKQTTKPRKDTSENAFIITEIGKNRLHPRLELETIQSILIKTLSGPENEKLLQELLANVSEAVSKSQGLYHAPR